MDKCERIINIIVEIGLVIIVIVMFFVALLVYDFVKEVREHPCVEWYYKNGQVHCIERLDLSNK